MKTQLAELTERIKKQQARAAKHQRAAERTKLEIEQIKKQLEESVVVAGIKWGPYLTPSDNCEEPAHYNEETGLWYFDQKSAILHAYEQNLRLPTKGEFQQLYDHTRHEWTERNGRKGMLFADEETGKSVFFPASGLRNASTGLFNIVGRHGYGWSGSVDSETLSFYLAFGTSTVFPQSSGNRFYGFPVRCVSE